MAQTNYSGSGRRNQHHSRPNLPTLDTHAIDLKTVKPELFNEVAKQVAGRIAGNGKSNKATQLRKFYDEIVMWDTKVSMHPEKFNEYLPFIRMINAKTAYARGRNLVDDNFTLLLNHCLQQVEKPEIMGTFKLFMEAFMGFYKEQRPKD